jgi:hypothetical protein
MALSDGYHVRVSIDSRCHERAWVPTNLGIVHEFAFVRLTTSAEPRASTTPYYGRQMGRR